MGAKGTLVSAAKSKKQIVSTEVTPVDTTGAGDAFIGSLLAQISKLDFPLIELPTQLDLLYNMVTKANKVGALTTTKYGAIAAIPELNEI